MSFQDHFSAQAYAYARYRPTYPEALFDWLASVAPSRALALDVGAGTGQAAVALASRFDHVIATEPSATQIAEASRRANLEYRCEPAESTSVATDSVDLVTVAQALHWFDLDAFFREVDRVLVSNGALVVWCYEVFETDPALDAIVSRFYHDVVGAYWPPERRWIERGYEGIALPFDPIESPRFEMSLSWTLDDLVGYLGTWSATRRYSESTGNDPLPALRTDLAEAWGEEPTRLIVWPLSIKGRRKARAKATSSSGRTSAG